MKKLIIFCIATIFIACGDDNSGNQVAAPEKRTIESSKYELGKCNEQNYAEQVFVANENVQYLCNGVEWNILQSLSSSSSVNSSSSFFLPSAEFLFSSSATKPPVEVVNGYITDPRDGQSYRVAAIGNQIWMAENLNYATANSLCYKNSPDSCAKYGRFYRYYTTRSYNDTTDFRYGQDRTDPCPSGWHVSTVNDWKTLFESVGIIGATEYNLREQIATLKATSSWKKSYESQPQQEIATDLYGFSILETGWGTETYNNPLNPNTISFNSSNAAFWMGIAHVSENDYDKSLCMKFEAQSYRNCALTRPQNSQIFIWGTPSLCNCSTRPRFAEAVSIRCVKNSI